MEASAERHVPGLFLHAGDDTAPRGGPSLACERKKWNVHGPGLFTHTGDDPAPRGGPPLSGEWNVHGPGLFSHTGDVPAPAGVHQSAGQLRLALGDRGQRDAAAVGRRGSQPLAADSRVLPRHAAACRATGGEPPRPAWSARPGRSPASPLQAGGVPASASAGVDQHTAAAGVGGCCFQLLRSWRRRGAQAPWSLAGGGFGRGAILALRGLPRGEPTFVHLANGGRPGLGMGLA